MWVVPDHIEIGLRVFAVRGFGDDRSPLLRCLLGAAQGVEGQTELHRGIVEGRVIAQNAAEFREGTIGQPGLPEGNPESI